MKQPPKVALGDLLRRADEPAVIDPSAQYQEVTIKLWGKGVVCRGKVRGSSIGSARYVVRSNQLILSKIDARNGAIGLVPPELDGALVSSDFPSFEFRDSNRCVAAYLGWLVRSAPFVELCKAASEGTTNRVRIKEERFLDREIALPPPAEQHTVVTRLDALAEKTRQVEVHLDAVERDAERLLGQMFRAAVADAPMRPLAEIAPLVRRDVVIDPQKRYTELGIRSFFKGTFQRRTILGADFSWQDLYLIRADDLVFSNIMAWERAIAIARTEDDGCVGNHRMLTCEANREIAVAAFLWHYFTTDEGFAKIYAASPGTAARNRTMTAAALMAIEVPVPPLSVQRSFERMQAQVNELKARHAEIRKANSELLPATLERIFATG